MRLKLVSSGVWGAGQTRVLNAETGEPIRGVVSAIWRHDHVDSTPTLTLELNDFEVEAELESSASLVIEKGAPAGPKLMVTSERPLNFETAQAIRAALVNLSEGGLTTVVDAGFKVYQLVDGRWTPIDPSEPMPSPEDAGRGVTTDPA